MQLQFRPGAALGTNRQQFCSKFGFCLQIRSISQHILNCLNLVIGDELRTRYSVLSLRTIFYPQNYNYLLILRARELWLEGTPFYFLAINLTQIMATE